MTKKEIIPQGQLAPHWLYMRDTRTIPISKNLLSQSHSIDDFINSVYDFVQSTVKYAEDKPRFGFAEYVQTPSETLKLGMGDCEDHALLVVNLLEHGGIPARMALGFGGISSHRWPETIYNGQLHILDTTVPKDQGFFPAQEMKDRNYETLFLITPFSFAPAKLPIPPIFMP